MIGSLVGSRSHFGEVRSFNPGVCNPLYSSSSHYSLYVFTEKITFFLKITERVSDVSCTKINMSTVNCYVVVHEPPGLHNVSITVDRKY